jgi:thiol-disulfide isomerase/thioredoxin
LYKKVFVFLKHPPKKNNFMKNLALLFAILLLASCEKEPTIGYAIISGKIENSNAKKITIFSLFDTSEKIEITLDEAGSFKDTLKIDIETYTFLLRQDANLTRFYAPKGSEINLTYDAEKKDSTLQITGDFRGINKYMLAKGENYAAQMKDMKEIYMKDEENFKAHLSKLKTSEEDLLFNTNDIPESFKNTESKNINYSYLAVLNNYESAHGYYVKNREFKASENFLDASKSLDLNNEDDFLFSMNYRSLVQSNSREKARSLVEKDSLLDTSIAYFKVIATIENELIKNKLLYDDAQYGITYTDNLEEYYTLYSQNSTNLKNNAKITASYTKIKKLASGSLSPVFTDYENNAGGKMSLEDLKGKYVYFDIWATWCGPCIAEIPSLKKVEKQFQGKNIAFVSVSIDTEDAYATWKKMIVDKELGGIQLLADNAWESKFVEEYMIKGIPRFIIIDPEGKIVTANAPRPSDEKLVETLNNLL